MNPDEREVEEGMPLFDEPTNNNEPAGTPGVPVDETEEPQARFSIGLTPFGGIGVNISDSEGNEVVYQINSPDEAWVIAGHLTALATMMVQTMYAQRMQAAREAQELLSKPPVWTPPGT